VAIYNIGAQVGNRSLEKTSYRIFTMALSMGAVGAFALAKELSPYMIERGKGTIIYTSATSAYRGNAGQHAHTAAMGARRNLTQSTSSGQHPSQHYNKFISAKTALMACFFVSYCTVLNSF